MPCTAISSEIIKTQQHSKLGADWLLNGYLITHAFRMDY